MIYGIGTDIVEIKRIDAAYQKHGERFIDRILTADEQSSVRSVAEKNVEPARELARMIAKRWAAKEAFAKAFGTGIGEVVAFHDFVVSHDSLGKPLFVICDALKKVMADRGAGDVHLSISDEAEYAIAFVVIERG